MPAVLAAAGVDTTARDSTTVTAPASGALDKTFDGDGKVITDSGIAKDVAVQVDGRIVVAGRKANGLALVRYNTDGSLDRSFGASGSVTTTWGSCRASEARALVVQPDGKILVGGMGGHGSCGDFDLARFNADGSLDTTFGVGGTVILLFAPFAGPKVYTLGIADIALQSDGKIVAVGTLWRCTSMFTCESGLALARFTENGSLDPSFGSGGRVVTDVSPALKEYASAEAVAVHVDKGIVVAGSYRLSNGPSKFLLARYVGAGVLDPNFGGGVVTTAFENEAEGAAAAVQGDGTIVVAGTEWARDAPRFALASHLANGTLDSSFGDSGKVSTSFPASPGSVSSRSARAWDLGIEAGGMLVAAGWAGTDFGLARYQSNGTLDAGFGTAGTVTTDFGGVETATAVAIQPDGKVIAAGHGDGAIKLARYHP